MTDPAPSSGPPPGRWARVSARLRFAYAFDWRASSWRAIYRDSALESGRCLWGIVMAVGLLLYAAARLVFFVLVFLLAPLIQCVRPAFYVLAEPKLVDQLRERIERDEAKRAADAREASGADN